MATIDNENKKNIRNAMNVFIDIYPPTGDTIYIRNDNLIRCTVSLRSDLSILNPTLPESEIEFEAYWDDDISAQIATMPDDMEIQYSAGYANAPVESGNNYISAIRYFYTDSIKWSDGVLTVHGVDQVGKLDDELAPLYVGYAYGGNPSASVSYGLICMDRLFTDIIVGEDTLGYLPGGTIPAGGLRIKHFSSSYGWVTEGEFASPPSVNVIIKRGTRREMIANLMDITHQTFPTGFFPYRKSWWPTYVDAGRPCIEFIKEDIRTFNINLEDCGDIKTERERSVSQYKFKVLDVMHTGDKAIKFQNDATVFDQKGAAMEYDDYEDRNFIRYEDRFGYEDTFYSLDFNADMVQRSRPYKSTFTFNSTFFNSYKYGMWLLDGDVNVNSFNPGGYSFYDLSANWVSGGYSTKWSELIAAGSVEAGALSTSLPRVGYGFKVTDAKDLIINTGLPGIVVEVEEPIFYGDVYIAKSGESNVAYNDADKCLHLLPDRGLQFLTQRSKETGSFTWKGDPRMQPRDFVELQSSDNLADQDGVLLQTEDGENIITYSSKIITLENITLTHEGGGTVAEITYREGYC